MKAPKYIEIVMDAIKSLTVDVKEISNRISDNNLELVTVKSEMIRNNEHMANYNKQLEIHIQGVELAHKRTDEHSHKISNIESDLSNVHNELTSKLNFVYKYIEEERQEKDIRKKLEEESLTFKEKMYKNLRLLVVVLGIPMAVYGLVKFFAELVSKFNHLF